jgi:hypothetical protein
MSNVWDLVKSGRYDDACVAADKESSETSSALPLRNKVFALLNLGRYVEATQVCRQIISRTSGESDSDFIFLGVSCWLLEEYDEAVSTWQSAANTKYTDAAGGVEIPLLLLFASAKLQNEELKTQSLKELQTLCKKSTTSWPGPVANYVLGKLTEDDVRSKMSAQPVLRAKQACQAAFYFGVMRSMQQDTNGYRKCMQESCEQGAVSLMKQEYYLARAEIR